MSKIDTLIKELQARKLKIDYVSYLAELIKNDKNAGQFKTVQKEILDVIDPLLLKVMGDLENDDQSATPVITTSGTGLTVEESNALKTMAQAVLQRANQPNSPYANNKPQQPTQNKPLPPRDQMSNNDKMNFAMNHRHLANKKVTAISSENIQFQGTVVGLDAPHVLIRTDAGPTLEVPVDRITIVD